MTDKGYFDIWMNPLQWTDVDIPRTDQDYEGLEIEDVLQFVCIPGTEIDLVNFVDRYKQINQETQRWSTPPNERNILEKMVWPLRQAKANYVLGNCLATVALCGMVAEMMSVLLFEINNVTINNRPITEKDQKNIYGSKFEKLSQSRRVEVLKAYGIIDDELAKLFGDVAASRNKYLHNWSIDHNSLENESRQAYLATVAIAIRVTGQRFDAGRIYMDPALIRYLQERGAYRSTDSPEP